MLLYVAAAHGGVTFWHSIVSRCCRLCPLLLMMLLMSASTLLLCLVRNLMLYFMVYIYHVSEPRKHVCACGHHWLLNFG